MRSGITKATDAVNYIAWMQQLEPQIADAPRSGAIELKSDVEHIEFRDTRFAYPLRPATQVLKGINLDASHTLWRPRTIGLTSASRFEKVNSLHSSVHQAVVRSALHNIASQLLLALITYSNV